MRRSCRFISIHVPRVEDDRHSTDDHNDGRYFNPRPPCGGRRFLTACDGSADKFQSTSPVWRTTSHKSRGRRCILKFQSTSPVWRTTDSIFQSYFADFHFNPRPPCGGRLISQQVCTHALTFQSTSPVWRTTFAPATSNSAVVISIHVPRVEDDSIMIAL